MTDPDPAELRRRKLIGRAILIGLGILLLAYLVPSLLNLVP